MVVRVLLLMLTAFTVLYGCGQTSSSVQKKGGSGARR
jgi:hypothetical protein